MVTLVFGDLLASRAQTLVNPVNCVGVMGKGLALAFKQRFPKMYLDYQMRCRVGQVKLGIPYLFEESEVGILNFPTKGDWRTGSRLEDIVQGLEYLWAHYREWDITELAVPALGCGEGGLAWASVGPVLDRYLAQLQIPVELYMPGWGRNP